MIVSGPIMVGRGSLVRVVGLVEPTKEKCVLQLNLLGVCCLPPEIKL